MGVLPVTSIPGECSCGHLELANGVVDIAVLEMSAHGSIPFNEVGYTGRAGKPQLLISVNPLDERVLGLPPFLCALHQSVFVELWESGIGFA